MDFSAINWLAVLACVVASMIIGSIWFSPRVFYTIWFKALGKKESDKGSAMATVWGLTILASLVEAIFVAFLIRAMGSNTLAAGLQAGFMIWLGFVATTSLTNHLFAGRPWVVWFLEQGNHLVTLLVMGAILGAWH